MVSNFHGRLVLSQGIHGFVAIEYDNASERLADEEFVTEDRYKVAYQIDNGTFWCLVDETGPTWTQIFNKLNQTFYFGAEPATWASEDASLLPWLPTSTSSSNELTNGTVVVPKSGILKNLRVVSLTASSGGSLVFTVRVNQADTALEATLSPGTSVENLIDQVVVDAFDQISCKITATTSTTAQVIWVLFDYYSD